MTEHRLRVFENRVLRRIFGCKRDEIIGGCREFRNEELHNLCSLKNMISINKTRMMIWAGHIARMGEKRNSYMVLVGNREGKRPLGRLRRRWEGNIKMDLKEIG
jgi:hypothetical protein